MWIKCSDKLPDVGVDVIVWVTEDMCCFDIGRMTTSRSHCEGWDTNHDLTKYRKITHWMPLPAPPKSDTAEAVSTTANSRYMTALEVYLQWCNENNFSKEDMLSYHKWLQGRLNASHST